MYDIKIHNDIKEIVDKSALLTTIHTLQMLKNETLKFIGNKKLYLLSSFDSSSNRLSEIESSLQEIILNIRNGQDLDDFNIIFTGIYKNPNFSNGYLYNPFIQFNFGNGFILEFYSGTFFSKLYLYKGKYTFLQIEPTVKLEKQLSIDILEKINFISGSIISEIEERKIKKI